MVAKFHFSLMNGENKIDPTVVQINNFLERKIVNIFHHED